MQRPFRFGIVCEEMTDREAWIAKARRVEELGYATLLLRDHFVAGPFGDQLAPIAGLMAAAMVTNTLRIGSMVFDNDYRHPVILGKEAATLDTLSGGRRMLALAAREADIVGILAGPLNAGEPTVNEPAAYSPESFAQKITLLQEAVGERFAQLELSIITAPVFTHDRRRGAEQVAQKRCWSGASVEEILEMPTIFIGTVEQIAEQMLERREKFGISYYMFADQIMETAAPLIKYVR